jgi:hypothetical protein
VQCGHIVNCAHRADCDQLRAQIAEIDRQLAILWNQIDTMLADPTLCPERCPCNNKLE